jgi:hypothetical protein
VRFAHAKSTFQTGSKSEYALHRNENIENLQRMGSYDYALHTSQKNFGSLLQIE